MKYSVNQIAELFPDLLRISDARLRESVAAVWSEALTSGCGGKGWTFAEIRAIPFTLLAGKIDLRFVEHLNSCCKQCIAIAGVLGEVFGGRVPVNLDVLIAGSLLADVGKMLEFDKDASGKVIKGHYGDMLRHPVQRRGAVLQARPAAGGDAHRGDAQPRGGQGGADDRELDLPPRRLHRLRHRQSAGQAGGRQGRVSAGAWNRGRHGARPVFKIGYTAGRDGAD